MSREFLTFKKELQENFKEITKDSTYLYEVELDKDELWDVYLNSFEEGTNNIFRKRREHDCSCCRHFIKSIGNTVVIKNGIVKTIWDFETKVEKYRPVIKALDEFVKSKTINSFYITKNKSVGTNKNHEIDGDNVIEWDHFYLDTTAIRYNGSKAENEIRGELNLSKEVFKRSLDEISEDSLLTVLELINANTLYRGEEWKDQLEKFLKFKKQYDKLNNDEEKELFAWEKSVIAGPVISKIKNHSIGTLLVNITGEMDLETAVRKYEAIVAPTNYKRPKAIFTKKMLEDAQKTITDLGYMSALKRRYAHLNDISVNNVLFVNRDSAKSMNDGEDVFAELMKSTVSKPKKFNKVEEITIDKFIKDVIPTATDIEVYVENKLANNFVSLIAPENQDSKSMFKWNNNFSWAYKGNIADSDIKQNVKNAGGKVDGYMRFSIQWNDKSGEYQNDDLDAHCKEPHEHIYFGRRQSHKTFGELDIDIRYPEPNVPAVENIVWPSQERLEKGKYLMYVNDFSQRSKFTGFKAEIECNGEVRQYEYNFQLRNNQDVNVAEVYYDGKGNFTIKDLLPVAGATSKEIWGVKTNEFVPVSSIMFSPNYWDEQEGIGNKHVFFMLKGCVSDETPNGFYNEFLNNVLNPHKRVLEALGSKMRVEEDENQLSGIGFSTTKRAELTVKVKGAVERVFKIKF